MSLNEKLLLKRELAIRQARDNFWTYCKILHKYKESWKHLKVLCNTLQAFYEGSLKDENGLIYKKLMINMPPRFFKSRTLVLFCTWVFGKNAKKKIIASSYSDDLATSFSRYTRDEICLEKNNFYDIVYSDIFPETKIKQGDASFNQWSLEGSFFSYKGCGFGSSITGKGMDIAIIDDEVKNYEEAVNETALEKKWEWYTGTWLSRLEEGALEIICMTRWSDNDICGKLINNENEVKKWYILKFEAYDKIKDEMLCPEMLSRESYDDKKKLIQEEVFEANYHQMTINKKGALYQKYKTYDKLPQNDKGEYLEDRRIAYIDTADEGNDYLCAVMGIEYKKDGYITDIYCTQQPQEITENKTAEMLVNNNIKDVLIESNNGGRAFARNVERILKEKYKRYDIRIHWFHQGLNKMSRILTNASNVEERIYYPIGWHYKYPEYSKLIKSFMRNKSNKNDDCADTVTGFIEYIDKKQVISSGFVSAGSLGL